LCLLCAGIASGESEIVDEMFRNDYFPHFIRCLHPDRILALRVQASMALSFAARDSDQIRQHILNCGLLNALLKVRIVVTGLCVG
jgi:hypothetical protein